MQRAYGNRAVQRILQRSSTPASLSTFPATAASSHSDSEDLASRIDAKVGGTGLPIEEGARSQLEHGLGTDLSGVRVHAAGDAPRAEGDPQEQQAVQTARSGAQSLAVQRQKTRNSQPQTVDVGPTIEIKVPVEPLGDLSGGTAGADLYLVDGDIRAADPLGQPFLGKVEGLSMPVELLSEGYRHNLLTPPKHRLWPRPCS
jgi:hypothetical protein